MKTLLCLVLAALLLPSTLRAQLSPDQARRIRAAVPAKAAVAPKAPRTVLVWNTPPSLMENDPHKGYTIPQGASAFEALGKQTGAYSAVVSDDLAQFLPENLRRYDAIVLNNASGPWIRPTPADVEKLRALGDEADAIEARLKQSFLDFVADGGGLVAVHYAIGANRDWPAFRELIGGDFTGHPWNEEVGLRVEDRTHPLVAAFDGTDFRLADEIYEFGELFSRDKVRVLISVDPTATNMTVPWIHRRDSEAPQAWVKSHGKGRVFYSGLGHRTEVWWDPRILKMYLDAVQFACGDLDAPTEPRGRAGDGFVDLFDGRTLDGWEGDRNLWSVEDGAITGRTAGANLKANSSLVWKEPVEDFELRLQFRLEGGNSGIYFRAIDRPADNPGKDPLIGMQADFDRTGRWTGVIMEYLLREVLAERGQHVAIDEQGKKHVVRTLGDPDELLKPIRLDRWNDYRVIAKGGRVELAINGKTLSILDDQDPRRIPRGKLALQVHVGPPMTVQFRDIRLRRLDRE